MGTLGTAFVGLNCELVQILEAVLGDGSFLEILLEDDVVSRGQVVV